MSKKIYTDKTSLKALNDFRKESGLPEIVLKKCNCLKCDKSFTSPGNWNRVCEACTRANKDGGVLEPYSIGKN